MNHIKTILAAAAVCLTFGMNAGTAFAEYPERNIELIFPWGPGSAFAATQVIAEAMGDELGVNISVVSTPGAAGVKAFKAALAKPADGYTLIDGWVAPLVLQPVLGNADWTYEDFIPLWSATSVPFALVTRKDDARWSDFPSFIQYMKDHPGELRYSSGYIGNIPHMVLAKVLQVNGVFARNVPYDQDGDAFKDLRGGLLDFGYNNPSTYASNSDAFQPLAVLNEREDIRPLFDNAPLASSVGPDIGLTGLAPGGWHWYLVQKGTPDDVVKTLRTAMEAALARPAVQEKLIAIGFFPTRYSPEQYGEIVGPVAEQLKSAQDAIVWETKMISGK